MIWRLTDENAIVKLFPLIIAGGKEAGKDTNKLNPDKLWETLKLCVDTGVIFIAGDYRGVLALYSSPCYWSDEPDKLINLIFQVAEPYRGGTGSKLIKAAKEFAGDRELYMHEESMRLDSFFKRNGFEKFSTTYKLKV